MDSERLARPKEELVLKLHPPHSGLGNKNHKNVTIKKMRESDFNPTPSFSFVGVTRFELATPRPPDECATRLRHTPKLFNFCACKSNS
jgi:hypothetical protein